MKKRLLTIVAALAAVALTVGAVFIFSPKDHVGNDDAKDSAETAPQESDLIAENPEGLTVGVGKLTFTLYPFFKADDGDKTAQSFVLLPLVATKENTEKTASPSDVCAAESRRVFYADKDFTETDEYTEGGYTASEYLIKDGIVFSNGEVLTADDVLFSLYTLLDEKSEADKSPFSSLAGLDDYTYGIAGISSEIEKAKTILKNDVSETPGAGDGYTAEEAADMRTLVNECGEKFAEAIKKHVIDNYCTDDYTFLYIFDGVGADEVRASEAMSNAYAMKMWNYGVFVYSYAEDPDGDLVGTADDEGNITYKTTFDDAMNDDECVEYVPDQENGTYKYDFASGEYVPIEDDDFVYQKYSKKLKDELVRISKTGVTGFRDAEGEFFTLTGDSFPTMLRFFETMKNSYIGDNGFDYALMESVEAGGDYSFSKEAVESFAKRHASGEKVTSITGIKSEKRTDPDGKERSYVTLYFNGNDPSAAYGADFYTVSRSAALDGYDTGGEVLNEAGGPIASQKFFDYLKNKAGRPVSAGPFYAAGEGKIFDASSGKLLLFANPEFATVCDGLPTSPCVETLTLKDASDSDAAKMLEDGEIMISLVPVTKDAIEKAGKSTKVIYYPNSSYKFILINPVYYKNIEERRALMSLLDIGLQKDSGTSAIASCIPSHFASYVPCEKIPFDRSASYAADHFKKAGYKTEASGDLIDPTTKKKASFTFYLNPDDEESGAQDVVNTAAAILKEIGADAEVVFDEDLTDRIFSSEGAPIFVSAWRLGDKPSLYERYAYTSGTDAVRCSGVDRLLTIGQSDNLGKITLLSDDGTEMTLNQADAADLLDKTIRAGGDAIDPDVRNNAFEKAQKIISELRFEFPLCEYNDVCLVRSDLVDEDSLFASPSSSKGPLSEIWNVKLIEKPDAAESSDTPDTAFATDEAIPDAADARAESGN